MFVDYITTMEKRTKKLNKRRVLIILFVVSVAAIVVFSAALAIELIGQRQGQSYYADLSYDIMSNVSRRGPAIRQPAAQPAADGNASAGSEPGAVANEGQAAEEIPWEPIMDFGALGERLPGLSAWILSEGTVINYPVMQWSDNAHFLSHLPDGERHKMGSVFMDYRNAPDFTDLNTLIYGHKMGSGDIFGSLEKYNDQAYYEQHPTMYLFTPERDYVIELLAGYLLDSAVETPPLRFEDAEAFEDYVADIKLRSIFESGVGAVPGDRLVCLCTCAYNFQNARLVVVGKLV